MNAMTSGTALRTDRRASTPRLYRRPDHRLVGGVASGIAEHLGVRPRLVRLAFVGFAFAGGLGIALYGAYWVVLPQAPGTVRGRVPRVLEYVAVAVAAVVAVWATESSLPSGQLFGPAFAACIGGALIWRQASETERDRLGRLARTSLSAAGTDRLGRARVAAGVVFVVAGAVFVLARADVTAIRDGLLAVLVTVVGVALVTGPWWMRAMSALSEERAARIRSQERADIAAHLHDSVLQTLALIQRNAGSAREVARLARGQERELRSLLYEVPSVDQPDHRQPVLFGDLMRAQRLLQRPWVGRAAAHRGVGAADQALDAVDHADPRDDRRADGVVRAPGRERRELEERRPAIEQQFDPFADEQLAAVVVPVDVLGAAAGDGLRVLDVERGHLLEQVGTIRLILR